MSGPLPRLAVVGRPVAHSLSPALFEAYAAAEGRRVEARALEVAPADLAAALARAREDGTAGWSVTLPHKVAIQGLLDELDAPAREAGAVNAVRFSGGRATGHNTDAAGFSADLRALGFPARGRAAAVLGAGGAARAVCAALRGDGVGELWVLNRTAERAAGLAAAFGAGHEALDGPEARRVLAAADLVVNATSAGLSGGSPLPPGARLRPGALAYDLLYRPLRTPFLEAARAAGARTEGGLGMLAEQAALSWRLWFGREVPAAARAGAAAALRARLEAGG